MHPRISIRNNVCQYIHLSICPSIGNAVVKMMQMQMHLMCPCTTLSVHLFISQFDCQIDEDASWYPRVLVNYSIPRVFVARLPNCEKYLGKHVEYSTTTCDKI